MKIAIILNKFNIGGGERLVVDELNELHRRGVPVEVITLLHENAERTLMSELLLPAESRHCADFRSFFSVSAWMRLIKMLRSQKYDVVITHLWFANTIVRVLSLFVRIPRLITFEHNVYDRVKTRKQFFADYVLQRFSTKIIAVSAAVRDSLVAHKINASRIQIIRNGIDRTRFERVDKKAVRSKLGLSGTFIFVFVGRLEKQKGVDVLLQAFAEIKGSTLLIVGDGKERKSLEEETKKLRLQNRVTFLGSRTDIPDLLAASDCAVFPSRWEGYGIVIAEALSAGVATIASDLPAIREFVEHGKDILLVPPEDPHALASSMKAVMENDTFRESLAGIARSRSERFSIGAHVDALLEVVQR